MKYQFVDLGKIPAFLPEHETKRSFFVRYSTDLRRNKAA